jgi:hypothetical protein
MNVYRLDPIPSTLSNPKWHQVRARESLWVQAESPDEARKKVALATLEYTPVVPGVAKPPSPWYDEGLALCVMDTSRADVPEGVVIKGNGRNVNE